MIRTSLTDPLRIATLTLAEGGGAIGITFCPGKCDPHAHNGAWSRDLGLDLAAIRAWGAHALVTLLEPAEFEQLGVIDLGEQVETVGLEWHHLPIADMTAPDRRFERRWLYAGTRLRGLLRRGGRVVVHCRAGLGRAGVIAARLLIELGEPADSAVARVRAVRRGAIQTREQMRHVRSVRPVSAARDVAVAARLACLLGGALGDAYGHAGADERRAAGERPPMSRRGRLTVSDDTQMTLFVQEGLARAWREGETDETALVRQARLSCFDWLECQNRPGAGGGHASRLMKHAALHVERAPDRVSLAALAEGGRGSPERPVNHESGPGGLARAAPPALLPGLAPEAAFRLAARIAALTHGHPDGYLPAGLCAAALGEILRGVPAREAWLRGIGLARAWAGHESTVTVLDTALRESMLARSPAPKSPGAGGTGAETLAIAVHAASRGRDFRMVLATAAGHDEAAATPCALTGQLFAGEHGLAALPHGWIRRLDVFDALCDLADWSRPIWLAALKR